MTSHERLLTVIKHRMPDRIPISMYEMVGWNNNTEIERQFPDTLTKYVHDNIHYPYMTGWHNREPSYQP